MPAKATMQEVRDKRRDGTLVGFQCTECEKTWISPVHRCSTCGNDAFDQIELPPEGEVVTYTIQNVAPEEYMNETPYAWAIIRLDDGTQVTGWVPYIAKDEDLEVGGRVKYTASYKPGVMFEKV